MHSSDTPLGGSQGYRIRRSTTQTSISLLLTFLLAAIYLIPGVYARQSRWFDRDQCRAEIIAQQSEPGFTKNTPEYFLKVGDHLSNGENNMTVTLAGCYEFCGPGSFYWDALPRITTWILPIVLLLSNIELSPIDKKRFMSITHAIGDPIDTMWSLIHKIYIWHRLYAIAWGKCQPRKEDTQQQTLFQASPKPTSCSPIQTSTPPLQRTREDRAKIIATVLSGFEEISGAKIESEDYYYMILHELGQIGEANEDPDIFEEWCRTARAQGDARTNEFLRTCLAIVVYIIGLIAAFIPAVGGGNTSPPGGRIGSALFLSWLVPLSLLSNIVGNFTSSRSCLDITRSFVQKVTSISAQKGRTLGDNIGPIRAVDTNAVYPARSTSVLTEYETIGDENNIPPLDPLEANNNDINKRNVKDGQVNPESKLVAISRTYDVGLADWQGRFNLKADNGELTKLIRKDTWEEYFDSLQWLGAIYTYRPWKVLYLDIDHRTHAHRKNVMMVLLGLFPVCASMIGAFVIIWYAVPIGFSCRHFWVIGIFVSWLFSALFTSALYICCKNRMSGHRLWLTVLIKDAILGLTSITLIFLSTSGLCNNCWCWAAFPMRGRAGAYVPLNTDELYDEYAHHLYSVVVGTVIGSQLLFYAAILYWWRDGLKIVRWTESRRRGEWKHEMSDVIGFSEGDYLTFWYNTRQLEREQNERKRKHRTYSISCGQQPQE
jgi:hypothetical protein